jgi:hypothetical protein
MGQMGNMPVYLEEDKIDDCFTVCNQMNVRAVRNSILLKFIHLVGAALLIASA